MPFNSKFLGKAVKPSVIVSSSSGNTIATPSGIWGITDIHKAKLSNVWGEYPIIKDSLSLFLNAVDGKSYPGTGTIWYDISGNGRNFTFNTTPTKTGNGFNMLNLNCSRSGGALTTTTGTISFWIKTTDVQSLFWQGNNDGGTYICAYRVDNKAYHGSTSVSAIYVNGVSVGNAYDYVRTGAWVNVVFTGITISGWTTNSFNTYGGYSFDDGQIGAIMVHNKVLSQSEITQNYNALKEAF